MKTDYSSRNWPILAQKVSKETFWLDIRYNDRIIPSGGMSKILTLQCYIVIWIHFCEQICISTTFEGKISPWFSDSSLLSNICRCFIIWQTSPNDDLEERYVLTFCFRSFVSRGYFFALQKLLQCKSVKYYTMFFLKKNSARYNIVWFKKATLVLF